METLTSNPVTAATPPDAFLCCDAELRSCNSSERSRLTQVWKNKLYFFQVRMFKNCFSLCRRKTWRP